MEVIGERDAAMSDVINGIRPPRQSKVYHINYPYLANKPCVEGVELDGDKTFSDLGMSGVGSVTFDHGAISVEEMTAAQTAALLTDD